MFSVLGRKEPGAAWRIWWASWLAWSTRFTTFFCWRLRASPTPSLPSWAHTAETSSAWATASRPLPSSLPDNWRAPKLEVAGEQEFLCPPGSPGRLSTDSCDLVHTPETFQEKPKPVSQWRVTSESIMSFTRLLYAAVEVWGVTKSLKDEQNMVKQ